MVRFLVYINNKPKTDSRFLFCATVRLTEPCPPLAISNILISFISKLMGGAEVAYEKNEGCEEI